MFGIAPLAVPAMARADVADDVIDQVFAPFIDAATDNADWGALVDPAAWEAFVAPAHWDAVLTDLGAVSAIPASADADSAALAVYASLHAGIQDWITSDTGQQVDGVINKLLGSDVIGNGAAGTAAHPDGDAGGWLFGDGGAGWNSTDAGVVGGDGGAAGLFGDGGAGGAGGAGVDGGDGGAGGSLMGIGGTGGSGGTGDVDLASGLGGAGGAGGDAPGVLIGAGGTGGAGGDGIADAAGGAGGDGGSGSGIFDSGGNGGDAGDSGAASTDVPALGGAGGNGGLLADHGVVGQPGELTGGVSGADSGGLSTTGAWFTDSAGKVVILHGLNEVYKVAPFEPAADGFGDDDAAFLAANGFNAVRLGIIWEAVEPEPGVYNDAYLASIAQTVQTLENHHIYVILDMHQDSYASAFQGEGAPAWAVQTGGAPNINFGWSDNYFLDPAENHAWDAFWSNAEAPNGSGLENDYAQMWQHVANYFNSDPAISGDIAGFEIMNEPGAGSEELPTVFGSPHFGAQELTPFYNQVASAIRSVDPNTPVLFEPTTVTQEGLFPTSLGTVDQPHTVFAYHNYCDPLGISIPCGFTSDLFASRAEDYAQAHDIPDLMDEFGVPPADPMQSADNTQTGWMEWSYTGQGDITGGPDTEWLVQNPSLPPTGDNVNTAHLEILAEPYPQSIAGTPNSWSFSNDTFQLSYSTEMASGLTSFPAGSQTDIAVPAIQYPDGYQVDVTGGHVVSAPNAPELVIASDTGADTVTVVVTPAGSAS